ncbi:MAG TPA: DUF2884 family protein [Dokdonella sp.]
MKRAIIGIALSLGLAGFAEAGIDLHDGECGLHSDYSLTIKPDALVFSRRTGGAAEVVVSGGSLRIDGSEITLVPADRERMLAIERGVRDTLPEVRAIAHEAITIVYDAVAEVSGAFARDGDAARASAQRLARSVADLHRQIDEADTFAHWNDDDMERLFEGAVGTLVGEVVGNVVGQAISVALSGDERAVAELQARADGLDRSIEDIVEKRSQSLERRASGLCPRLQRLARLGAELEVRLADGSRLQLVRVHD